MTKGFIKSKVGTNLGFRTPDFVKQENIQRLNKFVGKKPIMPAKYGPTSVRTQHKGGGGAK